MRGEFFSIIDYTQMIHNDARARAYGEALRRHINSDSIVMDIGAGTGFFSLLACKFGAKKVIAIEPNEAIEFAKKSAIDNGYSSRVEFFKGFSSDYDQDIKADIIISDLRGALPLHKQHIPIIAEARERFLAPSGVLLPQKDTINIALSSDAELFNQYESVKLPNIYNIDLSAGYNSAINLPSWIHPNPKTLLSRGQTLVEIDYNTCVSPNYNSHITLSSNKSGTCYGVILWFDAQIDKGLTYSNAPSQPPPYYRSMFLPFEKQILIHPHDKVEMEIRADLVNDDYVWTWKTSIHAANSSNADAQFNQSTFYGGALTPLIKG